MHRILIPSFLLILGSAVCAQEHQDPVTARPGAASSAERPAGARSVASAARVGMPTWAVLRELGRGPDHTTRVGAGCGMLDIMSFDDEAIRVIAIDGVVSAVSLAPRAASSAAGDHTHDNP